MSVTQADLTDVTLADEENNSIPADYANRVVLGNAKIITNAILVA